MINILFVDDDTSILRSIERILFDVVDEWNIETAASGQEALEMFEDTHFDILISDMRMPVMNGAELLEIVKNKYPWTVRFILSGYSDMELILSTVHTAEQFLAKPVKPDDLIETLKETVHAYQIIDDEVVRERISKFEILPAEPSIYMELCDALNEENVKIKKIASIVERDVILTSKLLKLVNSAFFGLRTRINSVNNAIKYLGFDVVKTVALTTDLYNNAKVIKGEEYIEIINNDSVRRAALSTAYLKKKGLADQEIKEAFLTSMLSDIGKLVFLQNDYDNYHPIISEVNDDDPWHIKREKEIFGVSHPEVSAYLLGKWGFDNRIVDHVRYHHRPYNPDDQVITPMLGVYKAQDKILSEKQNEKMEDDYE